MLKIIKAHPLLPKPGYSTASMPRKVSAGLGARKLRGYLSSTSSVGLYTWEKGRVKIYRILTFKKNTNINLHKVY